MKLWIQKLFGITTRSDRLRSVHTAVVQAHLAVSEVRDRIDVLRAELRAALREVGHGSPLVFMVGTREKKTVVYALGRQDDAFFCLPQVPVDEGALIFAVGTSLRIVGAFIGQSVQHIGTTPEGLPFVVTTEPIHVGQRVSVRLG